jgi:hypothetical protein
MRSLPVTLFVTVIVQVDLGHRRQHRQRIIDQPRHQRLLRRRIIPSTVGLARLVVVVGPKLDPARPWTSRRTRRTAATSWVTVSWVATASAKMVESSTRRPRPASTPVASAPWRTAPKIRLGRGEARRRARQYTSTVGGTPRRPGAARRRPSRRCRAATRCWPPGPDRPSSACSTITVAAASVGTDGWLRPWTTRSANSSGGNS